MDVDIRNTKHNSFIIVVTTVLISIIVPMKAEAIEPIPVRGSQGAQALQQAYNALLAGIQGLPAAPSDQYIRSVDAEGNIVVHWSPPRDVGYTVEGGTSYSATTATLSTEGNIVCSNKSTTQWMMSRAQEYVSSESFTRGIDGLLTYQYSGSTRSDTVSLTLVVNNDSVESSLDPIMTLRVLKGIRPSVFIAGGRKAAQHLANYVDAIPQGIPPVPIESNDNNNSQRIKCAYNSLLCAIQKMKIGQWEGKPASPQSLGSSVQCVTSIDSSHKKTVETIQQNADHFFKTTEILLPNGNIDILFESNNPRLGRQTERYERQSDGRLVYTLEAAPAGRKKIVVTLMPDGTASFVPYGRPTIFGLEAPGQWAAKLNWDQVSHPNARVSADR